MMRLFFFFLCLFGFVSVGIIFNVFIINVMGAYGRLSYDC